MGKSTGIAWCDASFNPWWGCERVSPACAHCYADTFAKRVGMGDLWPRGKTSEHGFRFFGDKHWDEPLRWARLAREGLLPDRSENADGHRPRVFCASMADVFEDQPPLEEHRLRLFDLIAATPELDWLLLTKRPEFARDWLSRIYEANALVADHLPGAQPLGGVPLPNVWMGVSIENARYTWRADVLREIPAAVRFISAEPLLDSLFPEPAPSRSARARLARRPLLGRSAHEAPAIDDAAEGSTDTRGRAPLDLSGIDWVIIGGESGPRSRPFHLAHAREIIRRCDPYEPVCCRQALYGDECCDDPVPRGHVEPVPAVFVKQLGAKPLESGEMYAARVSTPIECEHGYDVCPDCDAADVALKLSDRMGGDMDEWPADLRVREFPSAALVTA